VRLYIKQCTVQYSTGVEGDDRGNTMLEYVFITGVLEHQTMGEERTEIESTSSSIDCPKIPTLMVSVL